MNAAKTALCLLALVGILIAAIAIGSVNIPPLDVARVLLYRTLGIGDLSGVSQAHATVVWTVRLPRVLVAFMVGAALSVSGAIMQSVLRNPLASSFTLGVSSGASFGAALVLLVGMPSFVFMWQRVSLESFALPIMGFAFGLVTIVAVVAMAAKMDGHMNNHTIILVGMVLSLFVNAVTTLMMSLNRESFQRLVLWQMGSFSGRGNWQTAAVLAPVLLAGVLLTLRFHRELDIMTFGEEQSRLMGVNLGQVKWILLITGAAITGSAIAFVGIIGFVDLVAPHVVRRIFGTRHRLIIPMSAIFGGGFMMLCDLAARSVLRTGELPVGVVSALVGAPFFAYVYFAKSGRIKNAAA